ncbi:murein biosynthesis integral membrane protein MurJ [Actinotignum schaalii]|uniref:murein biosynthesis integral membrane protein MurJ n=1 Tax=Actinotignum schaalii TaxID=59505 RepID=UPI00041E567B|nr:lipid II flippase MurJ [Actinotignum schaalii]WQN45902.1 lipid II flippase MurJ [Actinotignum schaalii]
MKKVLGTALGAAGTIAILTLLSRAMGFVRAWVQNGALGDSLAGEAYSTANTVPNVLFEIAAGGALAAAVIPLVSGFLAKALAAEVSRTASALLTWVLAIGIPVAGLVTLGARPIMEVLLGADSPAASVDFAATLLRIFAWQIPLYGLSVVCTGLLQAHKKFVLPALAPLLSSVTVIITFLIFTELAAGNQHDPARISRTALYVLAWGTTAGVAVFSLPQLIPVLRRITLRPTFRFPPGVGRRALRLSGAGLAGLLAQQIQIIAVMLFANARGDVGTYPVFTFANQLYMVPYAVLAVPIATAVFPRLAEAAAIPGRPGLARITARSSRLVFDIGLLCVALLVAVAEPAQALFAVARPVAHMDIAMLAMAPALLGYAFIYHGSRVLYAVEAARAVIIVNSAAWLSVVVVLIGAAGLGVRGRTEVLISIGAAMSVGMTVGGIGHILAIRRAVGPGALRGVGYSLRIVLPAAVLAGGVGYATGRAILRWWGEGALGALGATGAAGALTLAIGGVALYLVDRRALRLARDAEAPSTQEMPAIAVALDEANA